MATQDRGAAGEPTGSVVKQSSSPLGVQASDAQTMAIEAIREGASVALEQLPEKAALEKVYDEVQAAAEAGNTQEALALFHDVLISQQDLQRAARIESDRQIQKAPERQIVTLASTREREQTALLSERRGS